MTELVAKLSFKDEKSDKVYNVFLSKKGKKFIVNFEYGKREGNLKEGTKTKAAVDYDKAKVIYDKLVKSKTDKGYIEDSDKKTVAKKKVKSDKNIAKKSKVKSSPKISKETELLFGKFCKVIEKKQSLVPFFKKVPKELYHELGAISKAYLAKTIGKAMEGRNIQFADRMEDVFVIRYFFNSSVSFKEIYLSAFINELNQVLKYYVRPDFNDIASNSNLPYLTRMDYYKKGYLQREDNQEFALSLASIIYDGEGRGFEASMKKLAIHKETLKIDIWHIVTPLITYNSTDPWEDIWLSLCESGKIDRIQFFEKILDMDMSQKMLTSDVRGVVRDRTSSINWFFKLFKKLAPTEKELLSIQNRLFQVISPDLIGVESIVLGFIKKIVAKPGFKLKPFLKKAKASVAHCGPTQANIFFSIFSLIIKDNASYTKELTELAKAALSTKDSKMEKLVLKFLEKHAQDTTVKEVKEKLKEDKKPKKLTKSDTGGWSIEEIDKISQLLLSAEPSSAQVAFSLLENRDFPKVLLSEVFAVGKFTEDKALKKIAYALIKENGSDDVVKMLDSKLSLGAGNSMNPPTEKTIKKNIRTYVEDNELDGLKIAQALYRANGLGVSYLLDESDEKNQIQIFNSFIKGTELKLNGAALTKFPEAIFSFPELTVIDLSNNKLGSIPSKIDTFKNLRILKVNNNNLKSIHKNIASLSKLEELYLNVNLFKKAPPACIFEISNLKKLDMTMMQDQQLSFTLPEEIQNLKKLEFFRLDFHDWYRNHDSYTNYPQIKEVTGKPINMDPLAIAEAAFDQGDLSPTSYIFKHGSTKLKKRVLDHFYDKKTNIFDFKEHFIEELPEEILSYDVKELSLYRSGMGHGSGFNSLVKDIKADDIRKTAVIAKLTNLNTLNLSMNYFAGLSDLSTLTKLEYVNLNNMEITEMFDFSPLKNMKELCLAGSDLKAVPKGLFNLKKLTYLDLDGTFENNTMKAKDFEGLKNLVNLEYFDLDEYCFKDEKDYKKVKKMIPKGCNFG